MFWIIFVVLLALWGFGFITSFSFAGFIHLLLLVAVIPILIQVIQGAKRNSLKARAKQLN